MYTSTATCEQLAERIEAAARIALITHEKPDGDALGSVLALQRVLASLGRTAEIHLIGPLEPSLGLLTGPTPCSFADNAPPPDDYDLIIVVDTGAWSQLEALTPWLTAHRDRVIGIDHHPRGDDVAPMRIVDPSAASTTQMLLPLIDRLGYELTGESNGVAEALFLGLATDTGWFRFDSAGAATFEAAARLLATGVDKTRLYQIVEENHRPQRLALAARALSSLRYARHGVVAIMALGPSDFEQTGGSTSDVTGLVNVPLSIGAVRVSALLSQSAPGRTKISFRSKPAREPEGATDADLAVIDVNQLAQRFGGGGHIHAAGARVDMDLLPALQAVVDAVAQGQ